MDSDIATINMAILEDRYAWSGNPPKKMPTVSILILVPVQVQEVERSHTQMDTNGIPVHSVPVRTGNDDDDTNRLMYDVMCVSTGARAVSFHRVFQALLGRFRLHQSNAVGFVRFLVPVFVSVHCVAVRFCYFYHYDIISIILLFVVFVVAS